MKRKWQIEVAPRPGLHAVAISVSAGGTNICFYSGTCFHGGIEATHFVVRAREKIEGPMLSCGLGHALGIGVITSDITAQESFGPWNLTLPTTGPLGKYVVARRSAPFGQLRWVSMTSMHHHPKGAKQRTTPGLHPASRSSGTQHPIRRGHPPVAAEVCSGHAARTLTYVVTSPKYMARWGMQRHSPRTLQRSSGACTGAVLFPEAAHAPAGPTLLRPQVGPGSGTACTSAAQFGAAGLLVVSNKSQGMEGMGLPALPALHRPRLAQTPPCTDA